MGKISNCLKLNWQMLRHALNGRWLTAADYAVGYDRLAPGYDVNWLSRLRPVTDRLLEQLPEHAERILDLGCGTGYTTQRLVERYPAARITGVDLSPRMLEEARKKVPDGDFVAGDMLEFLRDAPAGGYDLIVSAWAIGYSRSARIIRQSARVLDSGGMLLYVVNLRNTLPAVFYAYRRTLAKFPELTSKALWSAFPASADELLRAMEGSGFAAEILEESAVSARPPAIRRLDWLLGTGILAGFDQVLPLAENAEVATYFEQELNDCNLAFDHHYAMLKGIAPCC